MNGAIGLVAGALLGVGGYRLLSHLADGTSDPSKATLLRRLALVDLVTMPIAGTLIGGFVIGN